MSRTKLDIVNFALQQLRVAPISSLSEDSKAAATMSANFQVAKESILSSFVYDWSHTTTPLTPYKDSDGGYVEPSDCIAIIGLGTSGNYNCCSSGFQNLNSYSHRFAVRKVNGRLYLDSCCVDLYSTLHYICDQTNYNTMPADLFKLVGFELASISAQALTKSERIVSVLQGMIAGIQKSVQQHEGMKYQQRITMRRSYPFGGS